MSKDSLTNHTKLCWEWSDKNHFSPDEISAGSGKKVWWHGFCGHDWEASVKNRVNGAGCPYCSGNKVLKGFNDFASKNSREAMQWSPKNHPLKPDMVTAKSNKLVWWKCDKGHEWQSRVSDRSNGHGCPYCAGRILKGYNDLLTTNRALIAEWSEKNTIRPDTITAKSRQVVFWICNNCHREWEASVVAKINGMKCPHCQKQGSHMRYEAFLAKRNYDRSKRYNLPQKAFKYYARKSGLNYTENDEALIGLPLQYFFPGRGIAVEFSRQRANCQYRQRVEQVKNDLCLKNRIKLIRVISPGCVQYDRSYCIYRKDNSEEGISEAIRAVFDALHCTMDIDISRDMDKIQSFFDRKKGKR